MVWPFRKRVAEEPKARVARVPSRRRYEAAKLDRILGTWGTGTLGPNAEISQALELLRSRSRDLEQNNDYARRFLALVESNVVGWSGIRLTLPIVRPDNQQPDKQAKLLLETDFKRWAKKGTATVCGKHSFRDVQRLYIRTIARDGEILLRMHSPFDNEFNFALEMIEADFLRLNLNDTASNGNKIRQGIEFNSWGAPVAYYLSAENPNEHLEVSRIGGLYVERVPASDMIHGFLSERVGQYRGVPWLQVSTRRLGNLNGYEEAELVAARLGAAKMGFFKETEGEGYEGDDVDEDGNLIEEVEPGLWTKLPKGVDVEKFDVDHPNSSYSEFVKSCLRGVASGLGVSYTTLANDLEGVNYSSIRQGSLEDRALWRALQAFEVETLCDPVYTRWLRSELTSKRVKLPLGKFDQFDVPEWHPRGWAFVDPQKEVTAHEKSIKLGLRSRTDVAAEEGRDVESVIERLAREEAMADAAGVSIAGSETANTVKGVSDGDEEED